MRAGLESGGSASPLGSPVPDAWLLLGVSFKWVENYADLAFMSRYCEIDLVSFVLLLTARNVYDLTGDNLRLEVEVVDPIVDNMGMEVKSISAFHKLGKCKVFNTPNRSKMSEMLSYEKN